MQTLSLKQQNCIAQEQYTKDHVRDNVYAECISFQAYISFLQQQQSLKEGFVFMETQFCFRKVVSKSVFGDMFMNTKW